MFTNFILFLFYICNANQINIKNGVYNLIIDKLYLYKYKGTLSLYENFVYPSTFFRIIKISSFLNETFYNIQEINLNYKLSILRNKDLVFTKKKSDIQLWNFIKIRKNFYVIKNKDNCYIIVKGKNIFCDTIPFKKATQFKIIRIYSEVDGENSFKSRDLLNNEPIDILIKYIDLRDPNLNRNGIHQIEKDYDNEELRYSIRSIYNNIPWIRKIFLLMPNNKVRYFKD